MADTFDFFTSISTFSPFESAPSDDPVAFTIPREASEPQKGKSCAKHNRERKPSTALRLNSGTTVILKTPESDAWKLPIYKHGPIRLDDPRRKASLGAWEECFTASAVAEDHAIKALADQLEATFQSLAFEPSQEGTRSSADDSSRCAPILDAEFVRQHAREAAGLQWGA